MWIISNIVQIYWIFYGKKDVTVAVIQTLIDVLGESNAGGYQHYSCQFPAMIADWRQKFNQASQHSTSNTFPFGFVQVGYLPFCNSAAPSNYEACYHNLTKFVTPSNIFCVGTTLILVVILFLDLLVQKLKI